MKMVKRKNIFSSMLFITTLVIIILCGICIELTTFDFQIDGSKHILIYETSKQYEGSDYQRLMNAFNKCYDKYCEPYSNSLTLITDDYNSIITTYIKINTKDTIEKVNMNIYYTKSENIPLKENIPVEISNNQIKILTTDLNSEQDQISIVLETFTSSGSIIYYYIRYYPN